MKPAMDGRRAARDLARIYGFPPSGNDDAPIVRSDRGVKKVAVKHNSKPNTNTSAIPHNWHGRLPVPMVWFGLHVAEMVVVNGIGNAPCPLHPDRKRSLSLKPSGEWACSACGTGDLVGFVMRRYRWTFAEAVHHLVGVRQC